MYLAGYSGTCPPLWLRRMLAGSEWHRAWLLGQMGFFVEGVVGYGPANLYPDRRSRDQEADAGDPAEARRGAGMSVIRKGVERAIGEFDGTAAPEDYKL